MLLQSPEDGAHWRRSCTRQVEMGVVEDVTCVGTSVLGCYLEFPAMVQRRIMYCFWGFEFRRSCTVWLDVTSWICEKYWTVGMGTPSGFCGCSVPAFLS